MGSNFCHGCSTWFGDDRTKANLGQCLFDQGLTPTQNHRDMIPNDRDATSMARGEVARSNVSKGRCPIASCDATKCSAMAKKKAHELPMCKIPSTRNGKHNGETLQKEKAMFLERIARECKEACEQYYQAQEEARRRAMALKNLKAYIHMLQESRCSAFHKKYREHSRSCNSQLKEHDQKIEELRDELTSAM